MIIGIPRHPEDYVMVDDDISWRLQQKGFIVDYGDFDAYYFKKNKKLLKALKELNVDIQ